MSQPSIVMPCNKRIMIKRKEFNWYASWVIIDLNSLVSIINTRELKYFLIRETSCVITDNFPGLFTKYDWQLGSHLSSILRGAVHFTLPGFKSQSSWRRLLNSCSTFFFSCLCCLFGFSISYNHGSTFFRAVPTMSYSPVGYQNSIGLKVR